MELFHAANQWATRPADQRFSSLASMYDATKAYADAAKVKEVEWNDLRVEAVGDDLSLVGKAGVPALLTNHAFKQLCGRVGAPASYLAELPGTLVAQNLNHGLKDRATGVAQLLFHQNGGLVLRAVTSDLYERIWNYEVLARLMEVADENALVPAEQTFAWSGDALDPTAVREKSLYASDHDMFAFLMSRNRTLIDPVGQPMLRGLIVTNSEVGDKSLGIMGFWFRDVCANHIIWGARELATISLRHVGSELRARWQEATVQVRQYLDADTTLEQQRFTELRRLIAGTKEEVLDALFGRRLLPRVHLTAAFEAVVQEQDGDPRSVWGMAQGITRLAQARGFADERTEMDKAAGKLLNMALTF